jgi:S-adenosylmethionine hydrolase
MMSAAPITLTTDFGTGSPYVAALKGVILTINPAAQIVDVSHAIAPQHIRQAALALEAVIPYFPRGAIHVAVVDPGVGTNRRIVYACIMDHHFLAPDNGLLGRLADRWPPSKIVEIREAAYWRPRVSATFHGRDIMAPVAAHLSLGLQPERLGPPCDQLLHLDWPEAQTMANRIEGEVVAVDSFGNLITNITRQMLASVPTDQSVTIRCDEHETVGIFNTYAEQPPMTLIALVGSNDQLELAVVDDSARTMLGVAEGAKVVVLW